MSIFDHKKSKKSGQSKQGNPIGSLLKNFDEIAKEFLPTLNQRNNSSITPAAKQSTNGKPKSQAEIAKEFLPTNGQVSKISNGSDSVKSKPKSQQEIAKEFTPSKSQTFKHDNGSTAAYLDNQKRKN